MCIVVLLMPEERGRQWFCGPPRSHAVSAEKELKLYYFEYAKRDKSSKSLEFKAINLYLLLK